MPLILLAGALMYLAYLQGIDAFSLLKRSADLLPELPQAPISLPESLSDAKPDRRVTLYRWRDAQGGLHYGDQPPEDARELRALRIDPEVNVVKAFQTEVAEEESESEEATDQQDVSEPPALAQENDSLNQRHEQLQELIEITGKLLPGASR